MSAGLIYMLTGEKTTVANTEESVLQTCLIFTGLSEEPALIAELMFLAEKRLKDRHRAE